MQYVYSNFRASLTPQIHIGGEVLAHDKPKLVDSLVLGEGHVGDVLVDAGVEDVEDNVVLGAPGSIRRNGDHSVVDVTEEADAANRGAHLDRPLCVVTGMEEENYGGDVRGAPAGCTTPVGEDTIGDMPKRQ